ncbi:MAG TPA: PAS domain S-box protein [Aestuariivirga sp.]|nr:PAS domain S-box protein [Aestuariivirga sp.]
MQRNTGASFPMADAERYRILVEAITDYAVYLLDPNGNVASWNPGAQRFKGYQASEIIGKNFSLFYTPEDRAADLPRKALATAAKEGKFETEGWRVRKDGTRFWTHVVIDAIRSPSGGILGYAKITRDLTERKEAQDALRRSEQLFKLLVEGVSDYAIYMLDAKGHVASWNSGAQRIKGYRPDEIIGKHFSQFYTAEDREKGVPEQALNTAAAEGRFEREGWRVRKDGSQFWASVVIDAIKDNNGKLIGFAKITRDISEKRKAEQALEVARDALFQAQKLEAIGQLTGGIAHDFNNLLMVIQSSMELLRKRVPDDERFLSLIDNATEGVKRGTSLTQRMLSFARRQDLDQKSVNLHEFIFEMTDLLQRSLGPSIIIESRFPMGLSMVRADSNQLESALLNLAVNARDAMPAGGPLIISAHEEKLLNGNNLRLAPGKYVCLSIEDKGEGMSEDTFKRATEPFFTTKGVGKGTGLGLSMVQGFAEQSGGRLRLKSKKDAGTTAELWLPATDAENKPKPAEVPLSTTGSRPHELVVLAVDDDVLVRMGTAAMLEDLGHTVKEANSGEEALKILAQGIKIDLVVTDQAMPRMTGVQLAEAILAGRPGLPIILATGYAELPEGLGSTLPRLSKPFTQEQLANALKAAIGGANHFASSDVS